MAGQTEEIERRVQFLKRCTIFSDCTIEDLSKLALLLKAIHHAKDEVIVHQDDNVDSIYFIISGSAEVSTQKIQGKKIKTEIITILEAGDSIGFDNTGFYSKTGSRTATVVALEETDSLKLDINDFNQFLLKHPNFVPSLKWATESIIRQHFIKKLTLFSAVKPELLHKIVQEIVQEEIIAGTVFFRQGDEADYCYFLLEGEVDIIFKTDRGIEKIENSIKSGDLFGELALIINAKRNATVQAKKDCIVLKLDSKSFHDLLSDASEENFDTVTQMIMQRIRPQRLFNVTLHERINMDGKISYILKNSEKGKYFMLSTEALFVWNLLDGNHTIQDIAFEFLLEYQQLAEETISTLVLTLMNNGFVEMPSFVDNRVIPKQSLWSRSFDATCRVLTYQYSFKNVDTKITQFYHSIGYIFYTKKSLVLMGLIALVGFIAFWAFLGRAESILAHTPNAWLFIILTIPASILIIPLHELAHALTTKHYGYQVNRLGIGWFWFGPMAFADTSEMWLGTKKQRIIVNLAGIYINLVISGIFTFVAYCTISYPAMAIFSWLLAFYGYLLAFYNLDTAIELDGYYVLMDVLDRPNLRRNAIVWLVKDFKKTLVTKKLCQQYSAEIVYWLLALVFIVLIAAIGYIIQSYILVNIIPGEASKLHLENYKWLFSSLLIATSFISLYRTVKKQTELKYGKNSGP